MPSVFFFKINQEFSIFPEAIDVFPCVVRIIFCTFRKFQLKPLIIIVIQLLMYVQYPFQMFICRQISVG